MATAGTGGTSAGFAGTGGGGSGGLGGSSGGTAGSGQAGSHPTFTRACDVAVPQAPLVRYSTTDLEWTLDELFGPGPALAVDENERFDRGALRTTGGPWLQSLFESAQARVANMPFDEAFWADCDESVTERSGCAESRFAELGLRIYRRPLAVTQIAGYAAQFRALAGTSRKDAAHAVVTSMLLSPYFVFRIELGDGPSVTLTLPPPAPNPVPPGFPNPSQTSTALSHYEVAARLSHYLLRRAPDQELLVAAARGALYSPDELSVQVKRLLENPQALRARVLQHLEWLDLDDPRTEPLYVAMKQQAALFIADVLEERHGSFVELITSARQPLNRELAEHYGLAVEVSDELRFVDLDPLLYAGVLGQGTWLSRHPRPTQRGLGVQERLLCTTIPAHPVELPYPDLQGNTPRQRIAEATSSFATCPACHRQTDPIGFALEAFDDQGRLTGFDTTGTITLPEGPLELPLAGPAALGSAVARSINAHLCAARRSVEYLLDRSSDDPNERELLKCLIREFPEGELDLNALTREVTLSSALQRIPRLATGALGTSGAADPVTHALEECQTLAQGLAAPDALTLTHYCEQLAELQAAQGNPNR